MILLKILSKILLKILFLFLFLIPINIIIINSKIYKFKLKINSKIQNFY